MLRKIRLSNAVMILAATILLAATQLSYADYNSFTVNVPNAQGGYTAIVIQQSGAGYVGPQGEYYSQFPSVAQLQAVYGLNTSNPTVNVDTDPQDTDVAIAPPDLPDYDQPQPPDPNYIWTPGYWAYDSFLEDYYWVPGTWVTAPAPGLVWTPGYWYWRNGGFVFSDGYWGPHIGFYGGVNYGHGYEGSGSCSYNGGPGGTDAKPTFAQQAAMRENHIPPTTIQKFQIQAAMKEPALRASTNHGKPAIAATVKPGVFEGNGVVVAKQAGAFYNKTKAMNPGVSARYTGAAVQHAQVTHPPGVARPEAAPPQAARPAAVHEVSYTETPQNKTVVHTVQPKPQAKTPVVKKPKPKTPPANGDNTKNTQGSS